ncbi:MAG: class I SAM-dependent methyltransferase [Thiotrichaceae bacterium]
MTHDSTVTMLEKHHGGAAFAQLMRETATGRFDQGFWETWERWIAPVLSQPPVLADFGCGPAMLLRLLRAKYAEARLIGVEFAPYMVEAIDKNLCELVVHDLHQSQLSIADHCLDAAVSVHVLHELNQPLSNLREIHRCLKPQGRAIIMDWIRTPLVDYLAMQQHDINISDEKKLSNIFIHFMEHNRYTQQDMTALLQHVGFEVLHYETLQRGQFGRWVVQSN